MENIEKSKTDILLERNNLNRMTADFALNYIVKDTGVGGRVMLYKKVDEIIN